VSDFCIRTGLTLRRLMASTRQSEGPCKASATPRYNTSTLTPPSTATDSVSEDTSSTIKSTRAIRYICGTTPPDYSSRRRNMRLRRIAARTDTLREHCIPPKMRTKLWETSSLSTSRATTRERVVTPLCFQTHAPLDAHALSLELAVLEK